MGKRSAPRGRRWLWIVVLLIGCVLAGLQSRPRTLREASPPGDMLARVGRPVQSLLTAISGGVRSTWHFITHIGSLEGENARLREQLERCQSQQEEVQELRQEVRRLKAALGLQEEIGQPGVVARVIGRGPSPWFRTLTLDKGWRDGVRPGCVVVAPGGLVGQVYFVSFTGCKVLCLTDRQGSVGARAQPERVRHLVGVCRGDGSELCTLTYPDPDADLRPGDAVVTSGQGHGSIFPPGLLVGHVVGVERHQDVSSLVVTIRPVVAMDRVEETLVLVPADAPPAPGEPPETVTGDEGSGR